MKKTSLFLMATAIAAGSIFSSCKKEKQTPPPTPEKVCTLSKIFDANNKLQTEYVYVNDKLSKVNSYANGGTDIESTMQVSYDASGNISKVENTDSKGSVVSTQTYTYNPSGTINHVDVTGGGSEENVTLNFEYNGLDPKKPSKIRITADFMGTPIEVAYADYTYDAKGNNIEAVTYVIDFNGGGDFKKQTTATYTYDEKKNPNAALAAIMLQPSFIGPNNVLKETTIEHQNNDHESFTQNTYEYSAENYPVKNTSTNDMNETTITTMEYNCK